LRKLALDSNANSDLTFVVFDAYLNYLSKYSTRK